MTIGIMDAGWGIGGFDGGLGCSVGLLELGIYYSLLRYYGV